MAARPRAPRSRVGRSGYAWIVADPIHSSGEQQRLRVDMRVSAEGEPYVTVVNPNCCLEESSELARAAAIDGMPYDARIGRLIELASTRAMRDENRVSICVRAAHALMNARTSARV